MSAGLTAITHFQIGNFLLVSFHVIDPWLYGIHPRVPQVIPHPAGPAVLVAFEHGIDESIAERVVEIPREAKALVGVGDVPEDRHARAHARRACRSSW